MKIEPVSLKINNIKSYNSSIQARTEQRTNNNLVSYPANYYTRSFKGANIAKMYEEYNWYINHDHVSPISSFLKMTAPQAEMDEFLTHILSAKDRSYELIDSIVSVPRCAAMITEKLKEKVGGSSKNVMTFLYDSPYNLAYTRYIEEKYNKAKNVIELLKIRPDWNEQALVKKQLETGNGEPAIGRIPKQIPPKHLDIIIPY